MPPKFQIKPPPKAQILSTQDVWQANLEPALHQIFSSPQSASPTKISFSSLYDSCYRVVIQGNGRQLHKKLTEYLSLVFQNAVPKAASTGLYMPTIAQLWEQFSTSIRLAGDIFMYMDRSFCEENQLLTTTQLAIEFLRDYVILPLLPHLVNEYLQAVRLDRQQHTNSTRDLELVTDLLLNLPPSTNSSEKCLFTSTLANQLVNDATNEYFAKFDQINTSNAFEQMQQIKQWVFDEQQVKYAYLPPQVSDSIHDSLKTVFVAQTLPKILENESGVRQWVFVGNLPAILQAAELEQFSGSNNLIRIIGECFRDNQLQVNSESKDASAWVNNTTALFAKYKDICFAVNSMQWSYLREIQKHAINKCRQAHEFIANFIDTHLKKSNSMEDAEVISALNKAYELYTILNDREEFAQTFQRLLARRLLNNSSRSKDMELVWIEKLKQSNDTSDALKFEKMLANIEETRLMFHGSKSIAEGIITTNVDVLSKSLWPRSMQPQTNLDLMLPTKIAKAKSKFEEMYKSVKPDRTLKWNYNLSNAETRLNLEDQTYLLSVPLICLSILNCFQGDEVFTVAEISEKTQIPLGSELDRHLKTLYLIKEYNLLVKLSGEEDEISHLDKFKFNSEFTSPKQKIKIKVISSKMIAMSRTKAANQAMEEQEKLERTEETVMKVMEVRKHLTHSQLVHLVANNIDNKFQPSLFNIKRAIGNMVSLNKIAKLADNSYQII